MSNAYLNIHLTVIWSLILCLTTQNFGIALADKNILRPPLSLHALPHQGSYHGEAMKLNENPKATYPTSTDCKEKYFTQKIDHFSYYPDELEKNDDTVEKNKARKSLYGKTYQQRYFVCDQYWDIADKETGKMGPIFFYTGNEADVTLYVNATGLMWENAADFKANLIFAEHRYYGVSQPFPIKEVNKANLQFLSSEQALADYASLLTALREEFQLSILHLNSDENVVQAKEYFFKENNLLPFPKSILKRNFIRSDNMKVSEENNLSLNFPPVIGFGGSYGGMLCSWMRIKYPHILTGGCIAGSAPIWDFEGDVVPVPENSFNQIITYDASKKGGSTDYCKKNVGKSWDLIWKYAKSNPGLKKLTDIFQLCDSLETSDDIWTLINWIYSAWSYLAMGNFPYPSTYILNGKGVLPKYPVRAACEFLNKPFEDTESGTDQLLTNIANGMGIYYNATSPSSSTETKVLECYDITAGPNEENKLVEEHWDYQFCTEMFMPIGMDGKNDMFWYAPWNASEQSDRCYKKHGIRPRETWTVTEYGGHLIQTSSNIVFSNGEYDPWMGIGVLYNVSNTIHSILIEGGAHHLDLMFSHPDDPESVLQARKFELEQIKQWIEEYWQMYHGPQKKKIMRTTGN